MFEPIAQVPRYRLVAEALIDKIRDGSLQAGAKLPPDRVLVDQLGVSRATLREALIALEVMGYLENRFGAGAFVAQPEEGTARPPTPPMHLDLAHGPFETLEARRFIEGELAALAAEQVTAAQLDALWDSVNQMETNDDWDASADQDFHAIIADAAGNGVLAEIAAQFWALQAEDPLWTAIKSAVEDSNRRPNLVSEHESIIEALTEGDQSLARQAMHSHLDSFTRTLLAQWDAPEDGSRDLAPHARLQLAITDRP